MAKRAIVLLSGGLDSATILYAALDLGYQCHCLTLDYGQRHKREVLSAKKIAEGVGCVWRLLKIGLPWRGSALLDKGESIPQDRPIEQIPERIPSTYVPARNIIFLSFAVSWAEVIGADAVFIASNIRDFSGYPDCRPDFFRAFEEVVKTGTKSGVQKGKRQSSRAGSLGAGLKSPIRIETPLIDKTKGEIIKLGVDLGVPYELTWSCYKGGRRPCLRCDACILRAKGFKEAWIPDPLLKQKEKDEK